MKKEQITKKNNFFILLAIAFIAGGCDLLDIFNDDATTYHIDDGLYKIRSLAGNYLSYDTGSVPNCSKQDQSNAWYLRKAAVNGYNLFKGRENSDTLDLNQNRDIEGNTVQLWYSFNNTPAQRWFFEQNSDGSYKIVTSNESGRVITDNGAAQITIKTYNNLNTQKWKIERVTGEEARFIKYRQIMRDVNKFNYDEIVIRNANGQTDASLKDKIAVNPNKENMIEGEYVVLHLPNNVWAQCQEPKKMIDAFDSVYEAEIELLGRSESIHDGKMVFLTDYNPTAAWMYAAWDYCAFSKGAAEDFLSSGNEWVRYEHPGWGVGHEIGHTMVSRGMGNLFTAYAGESWCNVFNIYALEKAGLKEFSRDFAAGTARTYYGDNNKYAQYAGRDYDTLSNAERVTDILAVNTFIFLKFPVLLIDTYGWDGMRTFFTKAANDNAGGVRTDAIQDKIDYMAVQLSLAYQMDLSYLLDYWRVSPSNTAKARIAHLPKERLIAANYGM